MGETDFLVVKNRAYSRLAASLTSGATTLSVTPGEGSRFPSTYPFHITIEDEIVEVSNRATDTMTIIRSRQGTSAVAHINLTKVFLNVTAKSITDLNTAVNFIEKYADYGLSFHGKVTTVTDSTHFKVSGLAGLGASTFLPASGTPYEIFVFKADGAAPQGEQTPVVAYTTGDGTFQHSAYSQLLEVDDEVLIFHPLLASLGTKAAAAATGAVTDDDYLFAYMKQVVTDLRTVDGIVDDILTDTGTTLPALITALVTDYLGHGTHGLANLKSLIDAIITDIASAVPEPPVAGSLQDILHKDTNYTWTKTTDSLQAISDDIDRQHQNIHILFIIPEAVGSITADNTALLTEIQKLGDVHTLTQGDALEFPAFGSYAIAVLGSNSGVAWTTSNLADLKNILGLTLVCVDKVAAAYFEIGTDGGDATTKTVIRAISEIEGTKMGLGDANHQSVTGIDTGNNTVSSSATYHTLDMSNANITETVFCTEANDPDGGTANQDVVLGVIRRIQNDGSIGVDEDGADIPATLGFAGFAYEGDKLTTLGKALFLLFFHMLIQLRIQEQSVETGGLVADLRKRIFGNMKGSFTNNTPLVEWIAGQNSVGTKLPVGTSLADLINTIDGIVDTLLTRITAAVATASGLSTHDTDIKALLSTIAAYLTTEIADILTDTGTTIPGLLSTIQTDLDNPSQYMADLSTLETRLSAARAGYLDQLDFALQEAIVALPATMVGTDNAFLASVGGLLDTAVATGAVSNVKLLMAYVKQLVTEGIARDTAIGNIPTTMIGTNGAALASAWTAALATALGNYTATRAGYIDNISGGAVTASGPTKTEMDNAHALLSTAANLEDAMQKATGPAYNQDTDSLEAIREKIDTLGTGGDATEAKQDTIIGMIVAFG